MIGLWTHTLGAGATAGGVPLALDLMVILLVSAIVATLFARAKLESIPGYLVAGAIVGPHALGVVRDMPRVEQISELAVILLMFGIGLHLSASSMGRGMVPILGIGAASTAGCVLLAFPLLLVCGVPAPASLVIAMALAMSSTAIFVRVVSGRRELSSTHARVGLGVAIVQDLAAVIILALLPPIARWAGAAPPAVGATDAWYESLPKWAEFAARGGVSLGGLTLLLAIGRYVLPWAMRAVASTGSSELMLILTGAIAFGAAIAAQLLGFSAEMGAFLAGFLLASTPFRHQLSGQLAPMRDLLMAVFFTTVGLRVDPGLVAAHWWVVGLGSLGIVALKSAVIGGCGWALGMPAPSALLCGVYLGNAGEFALVVLSAATAMGALGAQTAALSIAVVVASLIVSPSLVGPAHRLSGRLARWPLAPWVRGNALRDDRPEEGLAAQGGHVVIAGYGPVGRNIADRLKLEGVPFVIVELNPETVARQAKIGRRIVYGDITNGDVLDTANVQEAAAVILTIPDDEVVIRACQAVRHASPGVLIAARASFLSQAMAAMQMGADHVTVEEVATAEAMQRDVMAKIRARIAERNGKRLEPLTHSPGDDNAGA